jgi:hypothetical protein
MQHLLQLPYFAFEPADLFVEVGILVFKGVAFASDGRKLEFHSGNVPFVHCQAIQSGIKL